MKLTLTQKWYLAIGAAAILYIVASIFGEPIVEGLSSSLFKLILFIAFLVVSDNYNTAINMLKTKSNKPSTSSSIEEFEDFYRVNQKAIRKNYIKVLLKFMILPDDNISRMDIIKSTSLQAREDKLTLEECLASAMLAEANIVKDMALIEAVEAYVKNEKLKAAAIMRKVMEKAANAEGPIEGMIIASMLNDEKMLKKSLDSLFTQFYDFIKEHEVNDSYINSLHEALIKN